MSCRAGRTSLYCFHCSPTSSPSGWLPLVLSQHSLSKEITVHIPPLEGSASVYACQVDTLDTEISPRISQTCRRNKAFHFIFPSVLFLFSPEQGWVIFLHSVYMPFAFDLYLHGLTWLLWLHFGGLRKNHAAFLPCFPLTGLFTVFMWFCNLSSLVRVFSKLTWLVVKIPNHQAGVGFQNHRKVLTFSFTCFYTFELFLARFFLNEV